MTVSGALLTGHRALLIEYRTRQTVERVFNSVSIAYIEYRALLVVFGALFMGYRANLIDVSERHILDVRIEISGIWDGVIVWDPCNVRSLCRRVQWNMETEREKHIHMHTHAHMQTHTNTRTHTRKHTYVCVCV